MALPRVVLLLTNKSLSVVVPVTDKSLPKDIELVEAMKKLALMVNGPLKVEAASTLSLSATSLPKMVEPPTLKSLATPKSVFTPKLNKLALPEGTEKPDGPTVNGALGAVERPAENLPETKLKLPLMLCKLF